MSETPPPIVLALVVCEGTYLEPVNGRRALVNLHSGEPEPEEDADG